MKKNLLIKGQDLLTDIIHTDYRALSVLKRFDILLGFGDATISEICHKNKINEVFFLDIINIYLDKTHFPASRMQLFPIRLITDFLKKSHEYYNIEKIPAIEHKINSLQWDDDNHDRNLSILKKFFDQYKNEVKEHTDNEENVVYPYAIFIEESCKFLENKNECINRMNQYSITDYTKEHDDIEEKLSDLKNIIIKYLPAPKEQQTLHEILTDLFLLENDLSHHGRIEEKILVPKILEMENELKTKIKT